jgi:hypothetical protein
MTSEGPECRDAVRPNQGVALLTARVSKTVTTITSAQNISDRMPNRSSTLAFAPPAAFMRDIGTS